MRTRNIIATALTLTSFAVLIPGLIRPLITIKASVTFMGRTMEIFSETRSIVQTIRNLHESGNDFVAGLIFLFGIVVPFMKGALLGVVALLRGTPLAHRIFDFVRAISKWAMADVFVVGVYVAFLAAKATDNLDAIIGDGFYYFVSYCLISLLALQFMTIEPSVDRPHAPPRTG